MQVIQEVLPVYNVSLNFAVPPGKSVKRVYSAIDGADLEWKEVGDRIQVSIARVDLHTMVVAEFN